MNKCLKCIHINMLPEDYKKAGSMRYVLEDVPGHIVAPIKEEPLCTLYGRRVDNYLPCSDCKKDKYKQFKERMGE